MPFHAGSLILGQIQLLLGLSQEFEPLAHGARRLCARTASSIGFESTVVLSADGLCPQTGE